MDTIESAKQWLETEGKNKTEDEVYDMFYEIIDSNIPIYNSKLLDVVRSNLRLWAVEPEIIPAPEDCNPYRLIKINIYEALREAMRERYQEEWKNREEH